MKKLAGLALTAVVISFLAACSGGQDETPDEAAGQQSDIRAVNPVADQDDSLENAPADTVFTNARIYTVDDENPWADVIAIRGNSIIYVGDPEGARQFIGDDTTVTDLQGKFMMPGIVSGHEHPLLTSAVASALFIPFPQDKEAILNAVREHLQSNRNGPFWSFGGNREGTVEIYRQDIDAIVSDRPFLMVANSGHGGWLNTAGLKALGLMKDRAQAPVDGFEIAADGKPSGFLSTSAATMYALSGLDLIRKEDIVLNLPATIADHNAYGITAVLDAGQGPGMEEAVWTAAAELEADGNLNLRISASAMAQRPIHLEGAFAALNKWSPQFQSEMFRVNTLKIHGGSPDGHSSPLLAPYSDRPDYYGPVIFPYDVRLDATMRAVEKGYYVHTHVMGDKAIREALDAFEAVRNSGNTEARLSTGHSSMVHPDDATRYAENDVTINWMLAGGVCQPDPLNIERLGIERMDYWCDLRAVADTGARLSMSADAPTAPLNPMLQIEVAVLQKGPFQSIPLHDGTRGLTVEQAIEGYTLGSAYITGWEDIIGSLEAGKRADLVVLDQNLLEIDPSQIHKTDVLLTMVDGRVVFTGESDEDDMPTEHSYDPLGDRDDRD